MKDRKIMMMSAIAVIGAASLLSCQSEGFGNMASGSSNSTGGLGSDKMATEAPTVDANNVTIPNISAPFVEEGSEGKIGNLTLTGIKGTDGNYIELEGTTAGKAENIWMYIDGNKKYIDVKTANENSSAAKVPIDVVFLVDNSGSMSEEADSIAKQILSWSKNLDQVVDCQFGCVGYGNNYNGIDGALNLTTISEMSTYFNRSTGTSRTIGFYGSDATALETAADSYVNNGYHECGCLALHYADGTFKFRENSNRVYINFTDEPNQPNSDSKWSVETLNENNTKGTYNWNAAKGTVHSVYSGSDSLNYYNQSRGYYPGNPSALDTDEAPWLMAEYTGGTKLFTNSSFTGFDLNSIEVTAAILKSFIIRFNVTDDLKSGTHTIKIVIFDQNGNKAVKEYPNVTFAF